MIVDRRPVASRKPVVAGKFGLDWVATQETGGEVPPPTPADQGKCRSHSPFPLSLRVAEDPFVRDLSAESRPQCCLERPESAIGRDDMSVERRPRSLKGWNRGAPCSRTRSATVRPRRPALAGLCVCSDQIAHPGVDQRIRRSLAPPSAKRMTAESSALRRC